MTENLFSPEKVSNYIAALRQSGNSEATIKRKLSSVSKFAQWALQKGIITSEELKHLESESAKLRSEFAPQQTHVQPQHEPKPFEKAQNLKKFLSPQQYFLVTRRHLLATVGTIVLLFGFAVGLYNQFFSKASINLAYPSSPTRAGRILNFQGFLTDSSATPITAPINMRFRLYDDPSAGTMLYDSGTCSITPDIAGGVVNVMVGTNTPAGYSCGAEIDTDTFTRNTNVYLGVTVGGDPEMGPRQQVANVGYAINSETLQGLPPGTDKSTIPFINQFGNLLIATSTPGIRSTLSSETFQISSANSLTLMSAGAGDITLNATQSGAIKFITANSSGNQIQASDVNLTSGSLYYGYVGNDLGGYNLLQLQSGSVPEDQFTVSSSGQGYFAGNVGVGTTNPSARLHVAGNLKVDSYATVSAGLNVGYSTMLPGGGNGVFSGRVGIGISNPTYLLDVQGGAGVVGQFSGRVIGAGGLNSNEFVTVSQLTAASLWQENSGALSPVHITNDLLIGRIATPSAATHDYFQVFGTGATAGDASSSGILTLGTNRSSGLIHTERMLPLVLGNATTGSVQLSPKGTTGLFVAGNGNVGVGTIDPAASLDVNGLIKVLGTAAGGIQFGTTGQGQIYRNGSSGDLYFTPQAGHNFLVDSGNVGIGTTTPGSPLQVNGSAALGYSAATVGPANGLAVSGNVGIGTTSPAQKLNVVGNIQVEDANNRYIGFANGTGTFYRGMYSSTLTSGFALRLITSASGNTDPFIILGSSAGGVTNAMTVNVLTGNVGIGTTAPTAKLQVVGDLKVDSYATVSAGLAVGYSSVVAGGGNGVFSGRIGIGTSTPAYLLDVSGGTGIVGQFSGRVIGANGINSNEFVTVSQLTANSLWQENLGALSPVHITDDLLIGRIATPSAATQDYFQVFGTGTTAGDASSSGILTLGTNRASGVIGTARMLPLVLGSSTTGSVQLSPKGTTGLFVDGTGNVGAGTSAPQDKLDVAGAIRVTTNTAFSANAGARFYRQSDLGTTIQGVTGSTNDFSLVTPAGQRLIDNPTGTNNLILIPVAAGNVGVGTTSPVAQLDLYSNGARYIRAKSTVADLEVVSDNSTNPLLYVKGTGTADLVNIYDNTTNVFTIRDGGNVGIGVSNPSSFKLEVAGNIGPEAHNTRSLGSSARYFLNGYISNIFAGATGVQGFWQRYGQAVSPANITDDLLIGNIATPSAATTNYFQIFGTGANEGDASSSGILTLGTNRTSGIIHTERMLPLVLGSSTTGSVQLSPKGTTGLFVDGTGNVGVGTVSPIGKLQIVGDEVRVGTAGTVDYAAGDGDLYIQDVLEVDGTLFGTEINRGLSITTNFGRDTTGLAEVQAGVTNSVTGYGMFTVYGNGTGAAPGPYADFSFPGTTYAKIATSGTTSLALMSGGNVGIGTTSPITALHFGVAAGTFAASGLSFGDGDTGFYESSDDNFIFRAAGTDRMTFNGGSGFWNILGTTTGGVGIQAAAGSATVPVYAFGDDSNTGIGHAGADILSLIAGGTNVLNVTAGNVGIGTTNPASNLHVAVAGSSILTLERVDASVSANDPVGKLQFYAHDSSTTTNFIVADIEAQATNTIGTDINPGRLIFRTTPTTITATPIERMRINEDGNVGIGITTPAAKLDINGNLQVGSYASVSAGLAVGYSSMVTGGGNGVFSGRIGIGTTTPAYLLDVSGGTGIVGRFSGRVVGGEAISANEFTTLGQIAAGAGQYWQRLSGVLSPTFITDDMIVGRVSTPSAATDNYYQIIGSGTNAGDASSSGILTLGTNRTSGIIHTERMLPLILGSTTTGSIQLSPKGLAGLFVDQFGNVGIGTTSPGATLDVVGNLRVTNASVTPLQFGPATNLATDNSYILVNNRARFGYNGTSQAIAIDDNGSNKHFMISNGGAERMRIDSLNGNVGIGITNPTAKLHVAGNLKVDSYATVSASLSVGTFNAPVGPGNAVFSGNVGIGTSAPAALLAIVPPSGAADGFGLRLHNGGGGNTWELKAGSPGINNSFFTLKDITSGNTRLTVDNSGYLGVGTTSPGALLDVAGNMRSTTGTLQVGNTTNAAYNRMGTAATAQGLNASDDLVIGDDLEVQGTIYGTVVGVPMVGFTPGSIIYTGPTGALAQDNLNFFWDSTNQRMGLGTSTPSAQLHLSKNIESLGAYNNPHGGIGLYQNRITQSEAINTWSANNVTFTANSVAAPNGETTADTITSTVANGYAYNGTTGGTVSGNTYTFSFWARTASGNQTMRYSIAECGYDGGNLTTSTVTPTWQRYSVTRSSWTNGAGSPCPIIYPVSGGTGSIYVWGAQNETGVTVAGPYAKTSGTAITGSNGIVASASTGNSLFYGNVNIAGYATASASLAVGYNGVLGGVGNGVFSGNVGIGTSAPTSKLHVYRAEATGTNLVLSNIQSVPANGGASVISRISAGAYTSDFEQNNGSTGPFRYGTYLDTNVVNNYVTASGAYGNMNFVTNGAIAMRVTGGNAAGNVGIGTTTIGSRLQVNGTTALGYSASTTGPANGLAVSGNVGIGTTAPGQLLTVGAPVGTYGGAGTAYTMVNGANNTTINGGMMRIFSTDTATTDFGGSVAFGGNYSGTSNSIDFASIAGRKQASMTSGGYLQFATRVDTGNMTEKMRIASNGNVGIGTTNPAAKLQIAGDLKVDTYATISASLSVGTYNAYAGPGNGVFSGMVGIGTSAPTSKLHVVGSLNGNIFTVNDGTSDLVTVASAQTTINNPTSFTSSGDVSIAYDINFTNPTSSFIKSAAPLTIASGETFNSSDLTLKSYMNGDIVMDAGTSGSTGTITFYDAYVKAATVTTPIDFSQASADINAFRTNFISNQTIIGALNSLAGGSSGSWIYTGASNYYLYPNDYANAKVGIGNSNPVNRLSVTGAASIGSAAYNVAAPANGLIVEGNVGIGTTNPASKLDIDPNSNSLGIRLRGLAETTEIADMFVGANGNLILTTRNTGASAAYVEIDPEDDGYGLVLRDSNIGSSVYANMFMNDSAGVDYLNIITNTTNSTTGLVIQDGGNVGIGTTIPTEKLHVAGTVRSNYEYTTSVTFTDGWAINDYQNVVQVTPGSAGASGLYEITIDSTRNGLAESSTYLSAIDHANGNTWRETGVVNDNSYVAGSRCFTVDTNGNSGAAQLRVRALRASASCGTTGNLVVNVKIRSIGRNTAWTALAGGGSGASVTGFQSMAGQSWNLYTGNPYSGAGNPAISANASGNVGIGTTAPVAALSLGGGANTLPTNTKLWVSGAATGPGSAIQSRISIGADTNLDYGAYMAEINADGGAGQIAQFGTRSGGTDFATLNLRQGNVGIGTTSPGSLLELSNAVADGPQLIIRNTGTNATHAGLRINTDSTTSADSRTWLMGTNNTAYGDLAFIQSNAKGGDPIAAGTTRLYIENTGDIGIGNTAPAYKLDVTGDIHTVGGTTGVFVAGGCTGGSCGYTQGAELWNHFGADALSFGPGITGVLTNASDVFIGDSLVVGGSMYGNATEANYINIASAGVGMVLRGSAAIGATGDPSSMFNVVTGASKGVTIGNAAAYTSVAGPAKGMIIEGNVGIGSTNPASKLSMNYITNGAGAPAGTPSASGGSMATGTYYYVVTVVGADGETQQSAQSAAKAVTGPTGSVALSWTNVTGAAYYKVYRTTTSGSYGATSLIATGTCAFVKATSCTDTAASTSTGAPPAAANENANMFAVDNLGNATTTGTLTIAGKSQTGGTAQILGFDQKNWTPIELMGASGSRTNTSVCVSWFGQGGTSCDGKIDAGTVDPPYTIDGEKFATYLTAMTGIKEETTGTVEVSSYVPNVGYRAIVDFKTAEKGSDIWLFSQVTNLGANMEKMIVLLTPSNNARTWYSVDMSNYTLTFFSSRPTTISYRLSAPRFDSEEWANTRAPGAIGTGFIIDSTKYALNLNNSGDLMEVSTRIQQTTDDNQQTTFNLVDTAGNILTEVASYAQATIAKIEVGIVTTQQLVVKQGATFLSDVNVSGTITAKNIQSDNILQLASDTATLTTNYQLLTSKVNDLQGTMDAIVSKDVASSEYYMSVDGLTTMNLTVQDTANLSRVIATSAQIGSIQINGNTLSSALSDLHFNALAQITFFDNAVTIAKDGTITTTGTLIAKGGVKTDTITTTKPGNDLVVTLANDQSASDSSQLVTDNGQPKFKIQNTDGTDVASIDASGSAYFADGVTFDKNIASSSAIIDANTAWQQYGVATAAIRTNGESSGQAVIPAGTTELTILNTKVKGNSLVYVTALSSTNNQTIYVEAKKEGAWFKIKIDQPISTEVTFNWWIL
ncbi:MAG: hypothetical protein WC775_04950 [Patescibacteria group bacterium]|jgi:hypothetical protein